MSVPVTIIVPTHHEADNVPVLVARLGEAMRGVDAEVLFVDDSDDHTPDVVRLLAETSALPVKLSTGRAASGPAASAGLSWRA